jgi:hypothetical protein
MKTNYIGILLFNITVVLFAQRPPDGIALDNTKTEFLDRTEITISDWLDYYNDMKNKYGDTSLEAKKVLPDTALFRQVSGVLCSWDFFHPAFRSFPIICVSYEQVLDYCQWREKKVNELLQLKKKPYTVTYSLPSKEDFEKALSKSIISQTRPMSPINGRKNKITGITDNVAEYTIDKTVIIVSGNTNKIETTNTSSISVGFRCKAIIIKK